MKYKINKKSTEIPNSILEELVSILEEKEIFLTKEEIKAVISKYFVFLKERIQTFEFMSFRLLNLGTLRIKPKFIKRVIQKKEELRTELLDSLKKTSKRSYNIHILNHQISNLTKVLIEHNKRSEDKKLKRNNGQCN